MRMRDWPRLFVLSLAVAGVPRVAAAATVPVPASPGGLDRIARVADRCPTFSWSMVPEARGYELVVYEMRGEGSPPSAGPSLEPVAGGDPAPALQTRLAGGVTSWTPSLDHCLAADSRYAWLVRALDESGGGEWSEARLFAVEAVSVSRDLEEVLDRAVRRYFEERGVRTGALPPESDAVREDASGEAPAEGFEEAWEAGTPLTGQSALRGQLEAAGAGEVTFGVRGIVDNTFAGSAGVLGETTAATGTTYGVRGITQSATGPSAGVSGESSLGTTYGVRGVTTSPQAGSRGVYGVASAANGAGIEGVASSTAAGAIATGVRGTSSAPAGRGVEGVATGGGTNYGVRGQTFSSDGRGVFGLAASSSGGRGVSGASVAASGYGGYFVNSASTGTGLFASGGTTGADLVLGGTGRLQAVGNDLVLESDTGTVELAGNLEVTGELSLGGTLDMNENVITEIGDAATTFDGTGGLTLAGELTANAGISVGGAGISFGNTEIPIAGIQNGNLVDKVADETVSGMWQFSSVLATNGGITLDEATDPIAGIENQNLLDKSATEGISGSWSFSSSLGANGGITFDDVTDTVAGIQNQNLVDKNGPETISGVWAFSSVLSANGGVAFDNPADTVAGIENQNLLDGSADETITGSWTFGQDFTLGGGLTLGDDLVLGDGERISNVTDIVRFTDDTDMDSFDIDLSGSVLLKADRDGGNHDGVPITIQAGSGDGTNKSGGDITLQPGTGTGIGAPGELVVQSDVDVNGSVTADSFTGDGSGLTSLSASSLTGQVPPANGGTGLDTSGTAQGAILYTSGTGMWATLAAGSNGQVLKLSGGIPSWAADSDSGGTVTQVDTGAGLTGGPITGSGTIDLKLNASGGLTKTLGGGSDELGVDPMVVPLLGLANTFTTGEQTIETGAMGTKGLVVKGAASQSANLQEWQDPSASVLASVSATGVFTSAILQLPVKTTTPSCVLGQLHVKDNPFASSADAICVCMDDTADTMDNPTLVNITGNGASC